jgi:hypothetical protein
MPSFVSDCNHFNYYYLNESGKDAVKRILCVYAYRYPDITYSPGLVSICSLLLHYLQEHEVYAAISHLFASKDFLVATRSSWETNCLVFVKLLKYYSVKELILFIMRIFCCSCCCSCYLYFNQVYYFIDFLCSSYF